MRRWSLAPATLIILGLLTALGWLHRWPFAASSGAGPTRRLYLFNGCEVHDERWHLLHTFPGDVCRFYATGELLTYITDVGLVLLSEKQGIVWRAADQVAHHQIVMLASGDFYFLDNHWQHRYKGQKLRFDVVSKMSKRGQMLSMYCTYDHLEAIKPYLPFKHPAEDNPMGVWVDMQMKTYGKEEYFHLNYLDVLPPNPNEGKARAFAAGNLLLSFPLFQMLAILDPRTYEILWTYTLDPKVSTHGQHCPHMLASGNILLFVNRLVDAQGRQHSKIVELDPVSKETVWSYVATPPTAFMSETLGCVKRLENGNTLITVGDPLGPERKPYIFEVTRDKALVRKHIVQKNSAFFYKERALYDVQPVSYEALARHLPLSASR